MIRRLVVGLTLIVAAIGGCGGNEADTDRGPASFFGVAPQDATSEADLARMAAGGVGSYHLFLSWAQVETSPGVFTWSVYDELIGSLAANGIQPIPYVFGSPTAYAPTRSTPPTTSDRAMRAWERFLRLAVARYGPDGSFWERFAQANPDTEPRPLRTWEIWNEVNGPTFWQPRPDPAEYATLLLRSAVAIRSRDPAAEIMIAGMFATPGGEGAIESSRFLRELYAIPGVADAADLVAVHPYGPRIADVRQQMRDARAEMRAGGDGDDAMWVTEIGWGSDPGGNSQLATTPERQARLLRETYTMMLDRRSAWNLRGVLWYTWRDPASPEGLCGWCASAGLVDDDLDPKPSWLEFAKLTGGEP
jgi:hypothetical protein